jgi:hypothetical protein
MMQLVESSNLGMDLVMSTASSCAREEGCSQ